MKRIVSFSLFGTNPLYSGGALRNAWLVPKVYPGWIARFYVSQEIPPTQVERLREAGAEVILKERINQIDGMFWRFLPAADESVEAFVSRDVDSRVTEREYSAVAEWLDTNCELHIMRDHPCHGVAMLGGMWGFRGRNLSDIETRIGRWGLWHNWGHDQDFLRNEIYPKFANSRFVHSSYFQFANETAHRFPGERVGGEFVGCVYDCDRDCLTDAQDKEYQRQLQPERLRCMDHQPKKRHRSYLRMEQWARTLRKGRWAGIATDASGLGSPPGKAEAA